MEKILTSKTLLRVGEITDEGYFVVERCHGDIFENGEIIYLDGDKKGFSIDDNCLFTLSNLDDFELDTLVAPIEIKKIEYTYL